LTVVIKVNELRPERRVIEVVGRLLRDGYLIAFPTETVYGLGANAFDFQAVVNVFKAKDRPPTNPLIVHLHSAKQLMCVVSEVGDDALKLIRRFWPGPLTIVLKKVRDLPSVVTGGLDKVGVRVPAHPVALELLKECGEPVVAPSANKSGGISPLTANDVIEELSNYVNVVLDSGETYLGIESTVIDLTTKPPRILRLGSLPVEEIKSALGTEVIVTQDVKGLGRGHTSFSRFKHYGIGKPMYLVEASDYSNLRLLTDHVKDLVRKLLRRGRVAVLATNETVRYYEDLRSEGCVIMNLGPRNEPYLIGKSLFKLLRKIRKLSIDYIVAEGIEDRGLGSAIMSRLRVASTKVIKV